MKSRSMAFARRFFSCRSSAPQLNDTTTEPRRIIETTDIIDSLSDKETKYARSAAESRIEIIGMAHDQRNEVVVGSVKRNATTATDIITSW